MYRSATALRATIGWKDTCGRERRQCGKLEPMSRLAIKRSDHPAAGRVVTCVSNMDESISLTRRLTAVAPRDWPRRASGPTLTAVIVITGSLGSGRQMCPGRSRCRWSQHRVPACSGIDENFASAPRVATKYRRMWNLFFPASHPASLYHGRSIGQSIF